VRASMINEEEVLPLDLIKSILERERGKLESVKKRIDTIVGIIEQVDEVETSFLNKFRETKKLNNILLFFFEGSDVYEEISLIDQELKTIESRYRNEGSSFQEKLRATIFDENKLNSYREETLKFLSNQSTLLDEMRKKQKGAFDNAMMNLKNMINAISRLLSSPMKIAREDLQGDNLKRLLSNIESEIQQIEKSLPWEVSDLLKGEDETFKGVYKKVETILSEHIRNLRNIFIENGLLNEIEIKLIETIYSLARKEFKFNELMELIRERIQEEDEKVQKALISLSEKGFLTLKVIVE